MRLPCMLERILDQSVARADVDDTVNLKSTVIYTARLNPLYRFVSGCNFL